MAPEGRAAAHEMAGQIYKSMGMRKEAEFNLRRSVELRRTLLGDGDDEELAFALATWGDALTRVDPDKAEKPLADALAMYRRLGTNKAAIAETLLDLAEARERAGKLERAAADFTDALALKDAVLPATRPEFAGDCLMHLGGMRLRAADPAGAAALLERAVAEYRRGQAHVRRGDRMSDALSMLGRARIATGDAKGAVALFREALPIDETFFGRTSQRRDVDPSGARRRTRAERRCRRGTERAGDRPRLRPRARQGAAPERRCIDLPGREAHRRPRRHGRGRRALDRSSRAGRDDARGHAAADRPGDRGERAEDRRGERGAGVSEARE
ncbi:MAG TPA: tetratricopeptide repeat protein [Tepidisphaeraceae bacterium]|nr:tetratricopeptide repeat protein [Tepidisphaeraceae bacterium]